MPTSWRMRESTEESNSRCNSPHDRITDDQPCIRIPVNQGMLSSAAHCAIAPSASSGRRRGGKSELHRTGYLLTEGYRWRKPAVTESVTENIPSRLVHLWTGWGKGEKASRVRARDHGAAERPGREGKSSPTHQQCWDLTNPTRSKTKYVPLL